MSYICLSCDNPIHGEVVTEGYCTRCLMGVAPECDLCGGELDTEDEFCSYCQENLDVLREEEDTYDFHESDDEEFLRGPSF